MSENNVSVEMKLARLEEIVALMESEQTGLEDSIVLYKEAADLAADCSKVLKKTQLTIEEMQFDLQHNEG